MYNTTNYGYGYDNAYYDPNTNTYIRRDQMTPQMIQEEQQAIAKEKAEQAYFFGGCQQPVQNSYYYDPNEYYNQWYQQGPVNYSMPQQQQRVSTDYYGNIVDPLYNHTTQYQMQMQYQQAQEQQSLNNHLAFCEILSKKCKHHLGIVDQQPQQPYVSPEERQRQYEQYMAYQNINHLEDLDNSMRDEDYVYMPWAMERQNILNNLATAQQEYPDDMSTVDMFDKLIDQAVEREFREEKQQRLMNRYNHSGYRDLLYQQPASPLAQIGMYGKIGDHFEPVRKQIGCFEFEENNGVVNVNTNSEYTRKREIFMEQIRIKNNRVNKGQMR